MQDYRKLLIWNNATNLVDQCYFIPRAYPSEEKYGLVSQITRSSVSVPANIAEGSAKRSKKDFARFLDISLGSLFELETLLLISFRNRMIDNESIKKILQVITEEKRMIYTFQSKILKNIL